MAWLSSVMCRGTLPFMAPELVKTPERINEKADCWSFGMLLWELLTLQSPFQELAPNHIIAGLMVSLFLHSWHPGTGCMLCIVTNAWR